MVGEGFIYEWADLNLQALGVPHEQRTSLIDACKGIIEAHVSESPSVVEGLQALVEKSQLSQILDKRMRSLPRYDFSNAQKLVKKHLREGKCFGLLGKPGVGKSKLIEVVEDAYLLKGKELPFFDEFWPVNAEYGGDTERVSTLKQKKKGILVAGSLLDHPVIDYRLYLCRHDDARRDNLLLRNGQGDVVRTENWGLYKLIDDILYGSALARADAVANVEDLKY